MPKRCNWDCRTRYHKLIAPLRRTAKRFGYALTVHGTLKRDIDLVAVPWVEMAVRPQDFVEQLYKTLRRVFPGQIIVHSGNTKDKWYKAGCPGLKCWGRMTWQFHWIDFRGYIDLSVMPRWKT